MALLQGASLGVWAADAARAEIRSSWEWAGPLQVCAALYGSDMKAVLDAQASPQAAPQVTSLVLGLTSPWVVAGPVSRTGLARILQDPLGFGPTSSVYQEPVGFALDASAAASSVSGSAGQTGLVLIPVPNWLGLYCLRSADGAQQVGIYGGQFPEVGAGAEALLCLSQPAVEDHGESWVSRRQPYPGGSLLLAAARLGMRSPAFTFQTMTGVSLCERSPPGAAVVLNASAEGGLGDFCALLACANRAFYSPAGTQTVNADRVAVAVTERGVNTTLRGSLIVDEGRAGFAPAPFLPRTLSASMELDRIVARWTRGSLRVRLSGEKKIDQDIDGERLETSRCAVLATARSGRVTAAAEAGLHQPAELSIGGSAELDFPKATGRLRVEARTLFPSDAVPKLSIRASGRRRLGDAFWEVELGVTELALSGEPPARKDNLVLKLGWRTAIPKTDP